MEAVHLVQQAVGSCKRSNVLCVMFFFYCTWCVRLETWFWLYILWCFLAPCYSAPFI